MKIWMIGARGTIATATAVGLYGTQHGHFPPDGVLTATAAFSGLDLPDLGSISVGGCDLRPGTLGEAIRESAASRGVFPPAVMNAAAEALEATPVTRGIRRGGGGGLDTLVGTAREEERETARDAITRIRQDLAAFAAPDEPVVMVNLASTEPFADVVFAGWDLTAFEQALDADDLRIPASSLYAYAALRQGIPYVNFTPSPGASLPALVELAREAGIPVAGRDGKTGETLVKTALAPMFAIRALTVEGWYGTNILGNTDGWVLAHADNRASKVASKQGVLEQCLGYSPEGQVRIDYFPPLQDHKVAWDFIQFRGWGGHRMRMQFTWEGTDAILAAPLVIDLARLIHLAHQREEGGPAGALGLFFKSPEGSTEMNLHRQYDELLRWARGADARDRPSPPAGSSAS